MVNGEKQAGQHGNDKWKMTSRGNNNYLLTIGAEIYSSLDAVIPA
jgi:hypothetical protein